MDTPDTSSEREIFAAAAALPTEERAAYLATSCAGRPALRVSVEAWLAEHEAGGFMRVEDEPERLKVEEAGERIGHYKLLEQIGEGGFGTVWMAEQEQPVRRRVALKIIKLGMDTKEVIARFEQERQALAMMDHPNIAKVFDAGATQSGRPFFVMELVRGMKITDYCDEQQPPDRRAARALHPGLPGGAARASERDHPPRPQAVEHPRHAQRRRAGAEGHRLRRGQGDAGSG